MISLVRPSTLRSERIRADRRLVHSCSWLTKKDDIYNLLSIIPSHDPTQPDQQTPPQLHQHPSLNTGPRNTQPSQHPPLRPCFYVWKPRNGFKKSAPGPPDFRIAVVSARHDNFPTLDQLDGLLRSVPFDAPPAGGKKPYSALKHGWRNVILAVVDQGVVSYIRIGACAFAHEKLYHQNAALAREPQGKRGGGGGGGGRGTARGGIGGGGGPSGRGRGGRPSRGTKKGETT